MKNYLNRLLPTLIIAGLTLSACQLPFLSVISGSGQLATDTREVSGFESVQLNGAGRLVITQGTTETLEITAEDNILDELTSEVSGTTLILGFEDQLWRTTLLPTKGITYNLTVIELSEITFNGAGNLETNGLTTDSLTVIINGAGQIKIDNLTADELIVNFIGTGTISVSGQVTAQSVSIDGAGNYQAENLQTSSTKIEIDGLGNGAIWATETLDIRIDGGGSLRFYGEPKVTQEIKGVGNIDNLGEK